MLRLFFSGVITLVTGEKKEIEVSYDAINKNRITSMNKRIFDITCSFFGLVVLSPVFLVLGLTIKFKEPKGTIFFKQRRVGGNGKVFFIYKFRSMKLNADQILHADENLYKKYVQNGYKLGPKEDPRVTKLGAILRETSLDELPQLFNVLIGNMSLVGPRPIVEEELVEYEKTGTKEAFLKMKPGITGVWQISGRSNVGYPDRVYLELSYLEKRSTVFDFKVIIKTLWKVLAREGAY